LSDNGADTKEDAERPKREEPAALSPIIAAAYNTESLLLLLLLPPIKQQTYSRRTAARTHQGMYRASKVVDDIARTRWKHLIEAKKLGAC
jgi:hypothetical protein